MQNHSQSVLWLLPRSKFASHSRSKLRASGNEVQVNMPLMDLWVPETSRKKVLLNPANSGNISLHLGHSMWLNGVQACE